VTTSVDIKSICFNLHTGRFAKLAAGRLVAGGSDRVRAGRQANVLQRVVAESEEQAGTGTAVQGGGRRRRRRHFFGGAALLGRLLLRAKNSLLTQQLNLNLNDPFNYTA